MLVFKKDGGVIVLDDAVDFEGAATVAVDMPAP